MKRILETCEAQPPKSHIEAFQAIKAENLENSSSDPEATHGRGPTASIIRPNLNHGRIGEHTVVPGGARGPLRTYGQFGSRGGSRSP